MLFNREDYENIPKKLCGIKNNTDYIKIRNS